MGYSGDLVRHHPSSRFLAGIGTRVVSQLEPWTELLRRVKDIRAGGDLRRISETIHGASTCDQGWGPLPAGNLPRSPSFQNSIRGASLSCLLAVLPIPMHTKPACHGLHRFWQSGWRHGTLRRTPNWERGVFYPPDHLHRMSTTHEDRPGRDLWTSRMYPQVQD